jgi:hypothetical protein
MPCRARISGDPRRRFRPAVETVTEPGKYFDGHGLFLRVAKNGAKQWVQRITIRGKRCELGLGSPPAVPLARRASWRWKTGARRCWAATRWPRSGEGPPG